MKVTYQSLARSNGWFPTCEAHIMFKSSKTVCRHLKSGEVYSDDTDSYMSAPLRHAKNWKEACKIDNLK